MKVTGAADSATGTASINNTLSTARADYIADELVKRGISTECIEKLYEEAFLTMYLMKLTGIRKLCFSLNNKTA